MAFHIRVLFVVVPLLMMSGCTRSDPIAYRTEIETWRQERQTRLTSDNGWLTLCGLFWLSAGRNTCGSDSTHAVVLPKGKADSVVGTFWCVDSTVRFEASPGADIAGVNGPVATLQLRSDADQAGPTILRHRTLSFYVIKRGGKLGVRVKDRENPARVNFRGLEYFPIDLTWRLEARFLPYDPPHVLKIESIAGTVEENSSPGALVFDHEGKKYRLDAIAEKGDDKELLVMFTDETSGHETYGGGRQMYTPLPDTEGRVVLDFNKAYNWPCVFTEYATCPIPPPQNRLPIRVEAGEKMYSGHE